LTFISRANGKRTPRENVLVKLGPLSRLDTYPRSFLAGHPVRAVRNAVGNHPSVLANRYLAGLAGIEIGGASYNSFSLNTINVDFRRTPTTGAEQLRWAGRVLKVDVVAPADELPFTPDAVDFVLASHVIEHLTNPIRALEEWVRVSKRYLFLIVPSRENPIDRERPLTPLAEQLERHRIGWRVPEDANAMTHWSVWSPETFVEMCSAIGLRVAEVQAPDDKRGDGFAVVIDLSS
jgi:SAM-dependent methyltransferase